MTLSPHNFLALPYPERWCSTCMLPVIWKGLSFPEVQSSLALPLDWCNSLGQDLKGTRLLFILIRDAQKAADGFWLIAQLLNLIMQLPDPGTDNVTDSIALASWHTDKETPVVSSAKGRITLYIDSWTVIFRDREEKAMGLIHQCVSPVWAAVTPWKSLELYCRNRVVNPAYCLGF